MTVPSKGLISFTRILTSIAIIFTGARLHSTSRSCFLLSVSAHFQGGYGTYSTPVRDYPTSLPSSNADENLPGNAKQTTALQLAKDRLTDAQIHLAEVASSPELVGDCANQLKVVGTGLSEAAKYVSTEGGASISAQELKAVEATLDECIESMVNVKTVEGQEARNHLRKVGRSTSSAEQLLKMISPGSSLQAREGGMRRHSVSGGGQGRPTAEPLQNLVVDYCPDHVTLTASTATIHLDKACGGKFHSQEKYSSGVFTALIRTPVKAAGVSNSFFISSNDQASDMISFDFLGNAPTRIITNYAVNGNSAGNQVVIVASFDTSVKFHIYTIKWDAHSIVWLVDNIVLRTVTKSEAGQTYPSKPGNVYGYTWDASTVANGAYAGTVDWSNAPFSIYFDSIHVTTPLQEGDWYPPAHTAASSSVPSPMRPMAIDYCANNIAAELSEASISFDSTGCGGRFRSLQRYATGSFTGSFKCAAGDTSGLLSSLYLSSLEGSRVQDEIDFEWLGDNKNIVQTNFYVNGIGGHETWVDLGFDCSASFHTYTIIYTANEIRWLVDGKLVRTVAQAQQAVANKPYPVKPVFYYASVWNASDVNNGAWTGKWQGKGLPFIVRYRDMTIQGQPSSE